MKSKLFLSFLRVIAAILFVASAAFAADSVGKSQIFDNETGKAALFRLHDNHDGTKSIVVYAVSFPSPTSTATATNTPTPTPTNTPTPTATNTPTPTPTP